MLRSLSRKASSAYPTDPTRTPLIYNVTRGYNDYPSAGWNRLTGVDNGQGGTVALTLSAPTNATLGAPNPATLAILDDDGAPPPTDEVYTYNKLGNLTSKTGKGSYSYPSTGSAHPHAVTSTSDAQTYVYDANGNMTGTGGLLSTYDAENRPTQLRHISGTEDEVYDADDGR